MWDVHLDQSIRSAADINVIQRNPTEGRNFMTNVIKRVVIHQYREIGNHLEIWGFGTSVDVTNRCVQR